MGRKAPARNDYERKFAWADGLDCQSIEQLNTKETFELIRDLAIIHQNNLLNGDEDGKS